MEGKWSRIFQNWKVCGSSIKLWLLLASCVCIIQSCHFSIYQRLQVVFILRFSAWIAKLVNKFSEITPKFLCSFKVATKSFLQNNQVRITNGDWWIAIWLRFEIQNIFRAQESCEIIKYRNIFWCKNNSW